MDKKIYNIADFGEIFEGENITEEQKWCNTRALQTAIDTAGQNGGGIVVIPEGTFYLNGHQEAGDIPGFPESMNTACIYITYGNIEIRGAGIDKTFIVTPHEYKIIKNTLQRVHAFRIMPPPGTEIEKLTFRDFDLCGGFHGDGDNRWPAKIDTGAGWDVTHKGLAFFDMGVKEVEVDHLCIHGYSGEIIYGRGPVVQTFTMRYCKTYDTNGQCFNACAHHTLMEYCQLGHPDYVSNLWIEYGNMNWYKHLGDGTFVCRNCYFINNFRNGVFFNEGYNDNYRILIENNIFDIRYGLKENNAHVCCVTFDGGTSGPVLIRNNTFISRDGCVSAINSDTWGAHHRYKDENITIENNYFKGFRTILSLAGSYGSPQPDRMINNRKEKQYKNFLFRNNVVDGFSGEDERNIMYLGNDKETMLDYNDPRWQCKTMPNLKNIVVEDNTFNNVVFPLVLDHYGSVPAFRNNLYNNLKLDAVPYSSREAVQTVSKQHNRVVPNFEFLKVNANEPTDVRLRAYNPMELTVPAYAEGYEVLIGGNEGTAPITFIPDDTNTWKTAVVITENNHMRIRFDRELAKWMLIELIDKKLEYKGKGADTSVLIGADMTQHIGTFDTVIDKTYF